MTALGKTPIRSKHIETLLDVEKRTQQEAVHNHTLKEKVA